MPFHVALYKEIPNNFIKYFGPFSGILQRRNFPDVEFPYIFTDITREKMSKLLFFPPVSWNLNRSKVSSTFAGMNFPKRELFCGSCDI